MTLKMLIDAHHPEETRVVLCNNEKIEEFDIETSTKSQNKGNVYLAKVTRVEPSLQAAFVDYGSERMGFLPFGEIHRDYYQIPAEDKAVLEEEEQAEAAQDDDDEANTSDADNAELEEFGDDEPFEEATRKKKPRQKRYKIQEVIKKGQVLLVQVVKEERGNKGAALTSYVSLPGRYCVLMPNTANAGGVSRKIRDRKERNKLKKALAGLELNPGMSMIIRTNGQGHSAMDIKRDYQYLVRTWNSIRDNALNSNAPAEVYSEGDIVKRSMRDLYNKDIEEVIVEGDTAYKAAKDVLKMMLPSHAKRVKKHKGDVPIFYHYEVEKELLTLHDSVAVLPSGGYLVINSTEALIAVDVNSGKATSEHNVEDTALTTNIEAAHELARQLRLRDLAGLVVIDFIDMYQYSNRRVVERELKNALRSDRAKIKVGKISGFGLLEMSRQRLRPSFTEVNMHVCPSCNGLGILRSTESCAVQLTRAIENELTQHDLKKLDVITTPQVAIYFLNKKRQRINELEAKYNIEINVLEDATLSPSEYKIISIDADSGEKYEVISKPNSIQEDVINNKRKKRRRTKKKGSKAKQNKNTKPNNDNVDKGDKPKGEDKPANDKPAEGSADDKPKKRQNRRRRPRKKNNDNSDSKPEMQEVSNDFEG